MPLGGPIRIPPLPQFSVFEDRDDGTEWVLSFSLEEADGNTLHISINDEGLLRGTLPPRVDYHFYPAEEGCNLGNGVRLFVRGGRIGYEMIDYEAQDHDPTARVGVRKETHQVVIPTTWTRFPDVLGWIEESPIP